MPPPSRGVASTRRKADERVIEADLNAGERERAQQPLSKAKDFHELEKNLKGTSNNDDFVVGSPAAVA